MCGKLAAGNTSAAGKNHGSVSRLPPRTSSEDPLRSPERGHNLQSDVFVDAFGGGELNVLAICRHWFARPRARAR